MTLGTLYLIPVPLGEDVIHQSLPVTVIATAARLQNYIVEDLKTARAFLKAAGTEHEIRQIQMEMLNEHTQQADVPALLTPLLNGIDVGLISDAGCPGIADPGADLVRLAHQKGIRVIPLTGPSSIVLALMAAGASGQHFTFNGYLPADTVGRKKALQHLEKHAYRHAQIFIETPYRNQTMLTGIFSSCHPDTQLTVACDLSLPTETIISLPLASWPKSQPDFHKRPCVFILYRETP
jgi:16S rRNA (cytidine1402-2'-O)-methyltransferase